MKVGVIAPMGTAPPVLSEFVDFLERSEKVWKVVVLATREKMVLHSAVLASVAVRHRFPHVDVKVVELPLVDITSEEENYVFMEFAAKEVARLRRVVDRLYLCVAGGRKEMVASMVLMAQLANVDAAYHVVSTDVKSLNVALERIRKEIDDLAASPSPEDYYRSHLDIFEPVMFPPSSSFHVVAVPVLPYPPDALRKLVTVFAQNSVPRSGTGFDEEFLSRLRAAGFISLTRDKIIVTDGGRKFHQSVLRHLT
ncbi:MAG: CRISPR-associated ring nuclease [Candidatus Caldarchaeum sp.]|nr:CRISPR-associated ring nuclease [Candidatus Caldarchaeum sp.]MCX8201705.1 CRISPR-associated ring nuclease [Candidatus Caldarchaeum sp.]MDW8063014.1 CRISPR-associated ring nuclease [Candidatus Caldarchaeum sp.]MDW8435411.1 CRISPR-associated ring nuclease [Candidatus Caldarchaeum sp.]